MRRTGIAQRVIWSVAAVGTAASIAGLATFASFTGSTNVDQDVTSGTLTITLGASGTADNRLDVAASDIAPGDTIQRAVKLTSGGTVDLASITLTTEATTSSALDTDATDGLQMTVERCSVAWTESGPPYTYTCGGSTTTVIAERPVVGSDIAMNNMSATTSGNTDNLRVTLRLPTTAGDSFQGLSSTIRYTFSGTQRAGTAT